MIHVSRSIVLRTAVFLCLMVQCGKGIEIKVLKPAHGSQTILNPRDSFEIEIRLRDMQAVPGKRCHLYTLGLYNLERELYVGSLCNCWPENEFHVEMSECYINLWSGRLSSSIIELVAYITDHQGAEVAHSSTRFILATRNDTLLHSLIQDLRGSTRKDQIRVLDELTWLQTLSKTENKVFSQNTEDGAIVEVFKHFGTTDKLAVEFGAEDGREVNSRRLWEELGWRGILLDGDNQNLALHPNATLHKAFITPHNIASLLTALGVPREFDLLSIDLDFNDFWTLQRILRSFRPRVVVAEINRNFGPGESFTVPMNASFHWTGQSNKGFPHGTGYFGMSVGALARLAASRGYTLIYVFLDAVNALLVRNDLLAPGLQEVITLDVVMPEKVAGIHQSYHGAQKWVDVAEGDSEGELSYSEVWMTMRDGDPLKEARSIQGSVWLHRHFDYADPPVA